MRPLLLALLVCAAAPALAQPCLVSYTLTQSPQPTNGTYACGQTVTFCFTVTNWNSTNANWFHGIVANFGPGWDMSTLTPGPPPASCSGTGTWGWYTSVQGTAGTNIGTQGPGFFYNYTTPADANPGNNFGDFCTGAVNWQFCWTISVLSPPACVNGTSLSVSFNTFGDSETGAWSSAGCGQDPIVPGSPAVIQACSVNAGIGSTLTVCSNGAPVSLGSGLLGTPDPGGTWTSPSGAQVPGVFNPATDPPGAYTYTVSSNAPPCSQSATVTMVVVQQPSAGTAGSATLCASDPPLNLFSLLGGSPSAGGSWTGPGGASTGTFNPATDPPGDYTYTVTAGLPCANASAVVTVNVNPSPNAGANGSLTLCSNSAPANLFASLGGAPSAGGTWSGPAGPMNGTFNPGVNNAGTYTYTVNGIAPCPNSSASVTVSVNTLPNAGNDASTALCASATSANLLGLLGGTPDPGGSWTGPSGGAVGGTINPSTAASGAYVYTVAGTAPCPSASATLSLAINPQPDAGSNATVNLCTASAPIDLFNSLGGTPDPGGTWNGPAGLVANTVFTPGTSPPGAYTYTITALPPCANASATVTVNVSPQPSAGTNGVLSVCSNGSAVSLQASLGANAQPGGSWTGPTGAASSGSFTPGISADGAYTYTIAGVPPCPSASATVTVTTVQAANPGTNGALAVCSSGTPVSLASALGGNPQSGGAWTSPSGAATSATLNPVSAMSGPYTYTIAANGPCPAASAVVAVTVAQAVSAGSSGSQALCSTAAGFALAGALGGSPTPGGAWTAPNGSPHGPTFNAGTDAPGAYTYTVSATAPCPSASSTVTMSVVQAPNAGTGATVALCANAAPVDPSGWLGGNPQPGGAWTGPGGSTITVIDPSTAASGSYTYTVQGTAPCPSAQAVVQLTISPLPNAGSDGLLNICLNGPATNLLALLSGAQSGGSWSGPSGAFNGTFTPGQHAPGIYTYTVNGTGACAAESDQSQVTVNVSPLPQPSFTADVTRGCAPLQVTFSNTTPGSLLSAGWSFGDGGMASTVANATHTYASPGQRTVALTVTDQNGCTATQSVSNAILVSGGPSASFSALPLRVSVNAPTTTISHSTQPGVGYAWEIDGTAVDTSGSFQWTFSPATVGYREICLTATDSLGCDNRFCLRVLIDDDMTIWVPNAFTPNGDDKNDVWRPSVIGVEEGWYRLLIFDRWGLQVFGTDEPAQGWNGTLDNGGAELPQDVYVWMLKAKDQFTPAKADLIGTVTLLR